MGRQPPSGIGEAGRAILSADQRRLQREATDREAVWQQIREKAESRNASEPRPVGYEPPAFNTPQYWRDCGRGWISEARQRQDQADFEARQRRALDSKQNKARSPHRHQRSAPRSTKQFSKAMSTEAARDDRLTPQSKALLQVLVARTGRGRSTDTTKTTLGVVMNRCPRSIQRYIQELVKFGYIRTQVRKSRRTGFYIGLRVWIMDRVLPFFAKGGVNYDPGQWSDWLRNRRNREGTEESLTNINNRILKTLGAKKPPWWGEFAY